jgi:hypothetical protein
MQIAYRRLEQSHVNTNFARWCPIEDQVRTAQRDTQQTADIAALRVNVTWPAMTSERWTARSRVVQRMVPDQSRRELWTRAVQGWLAVQTRPKTQLKAMQFQSQRNI